jgi:L-ribulose-5-phosphate 4-epimerase
MEPSADQRLRQELVAAVRLLFEANVMSASGHGNFSARSGDEGFLLTAGGSLRGTRPDDLVWVPLGGVETPSLLPVVAEIVPMHREVHRLGLDGVRAVVHTHSPAVTAFAVANRPLPCVYEAMLRFGLDEDVPVAAWAPRGSSASVSNVIELLRQRPTRRAVLLGNHGLLAMGRSPEEAARLVVAMEEGAAAVIAAQALGGAVPFPAGALQTEQAHMARFGSPAG